jgi:asparagine synthase (glutamine-hydrolysing)
MNTIFGIWRPHGMVVTKGKLLALGAPTARFTSDGSFLRTASEIGMGVQTWHTDQRSHSDNQPFSDALGNVLAYDGRLDNHRDLIASLGITESDAADSVIILEAYRRWGCDCFAKFVGDWSLSLWDSHRRMLFLARDHAGTRTLYYSRDSFGSVVWSTYLDSFLGSDLLNTHDKQYLASYLAMLPNYQSTPYRDVQAVLPGHVLEIRVSGITNRQHWTPLVHDRLALKSDREYDEQFLTLFEQAVARRTEPGIPALAQLSGGMDSTSIVCVSDRWRMSCNSNADLIDTLSYYNDSEPTWNEKPYFSLVEARRKKQGIHVDTSIYRASIDKAPNDGGLYLFPGSSRTEFQRDSDLLRILGGRYRVMISGIGGDELTGAVVDPAAELADFIAAGRPAGAIRRATSWSLANRSNFFRLCVDSMRYIHDQMNHASVSAIPWLTKDTRERCYTALQDLPLSIYRPFGVHPSAVGASRTWWFTLRTQPHLRPSEIYRFEYRYPYLDRDLVDFLLKVPLQQLSAPGRRRFMMRRALKGIVPEEILERRRKAFLMQTPLARVSYLAPTLRALINSSTLADLGCIDPKALIKALNDTTTGTNVQWWGLILRYAHLETWLKFRSAEPVKYHATDFSADPIPAASAGRVPAT